MEKNADEYNEISLQSPRKNRAIFSPKYGWVCYANGRVLAREESTQIVAMIEKKYNKTQLPYTLQIRVTTSIYLKNGCVVIHTDTFMTETLVEGLLTNYVNASYGPHVDDNTFIFVNTSRSELIKSYFASRHTLKWTWRGDNFILIVSRDNE